MKLRAMASLGVLCLALFATAKPVAGGDHDDFDGLVPGEFVVHKQLIPIRIVLVGFEEGQVNENDLKGVLPSTYKPLVRFPQFYGLSGRDMGLEYEFQYRIVTKGRSFTNRLFHHLKQIGTEGPLTLYQESYNNQTKNVLDVTGPVLYIDGPRLERWLKEQDDPQNRSYTIYFINWYGREDFRFHVYTKTDAPDPDTHFNFGLLPHTAINSWGGTSSRTWFYDFSAGPEWNSTNWFVDAEDLDGDGVNEYRMPVTWEYATGGYRSPDLLGHDMGLLARYVAINLLFTPSPLYDPLVTAPGPRGVKVADISLFEDDPVSKGQDFISPAFANARWRRFQPYYRWKTGFRDFDPIDAGAKNTLDIFTLNNPVSDCWVPFGTPFAQLFCYFDQNLASYVPPYGARDYVGEVFAFNTTEAGLGAAIGLLGFADDNWVDGTQTFAFVFGADIYRSLGYGFTSTIVHEFGHHIGMSHPHDGYDSATGVDYGPGGEFYYAWEGDESDTVMHYLTLSNGFGRHNSDNMYRWETAGYLNWANALAGDILGSPDASKVRHALRRADHAAGQAKRDFLAWRYLSAVQNARNAYIILVKAAEEVGVASATLAAARTPLPGYQPRKEGCRPRLMQERMGRR